MAKYWSVLFAVVMLGCLGMFVVAPFVGWWLPEGVSTHAAAVDRLFYFILAVTGFFFILTEGLMCIFMWKYAACPCAEKTVCEPAKPNFFSKLMAPIQRILHDQHRVEMAWTLAPALILLYIAFAQVSAWADIKYKSRNPLLKEQNRTDYLQVEVSARQFEWRMRYPAASRFKEWVASKDSKGSKDEGLVTDFRTFDKKPQKSDVRVVNELHVVKGQQVVVHLGTRDVIHSFNLPHFRVKQDALPGKVIPVWFVPTKANCRRNTGTGEWEDGVHPQTGEPDKLLIWDLACAELCGWGHYRMIGRVFVHETQEDFQAWLDHTDKKMNARK